MYKYRKKSPNISGSHSQRQRTASERSNASQTEHKPTHYKAHAGKCSSFEIVNAQTSTPRMKKKNCKTKLER